jgi:hypothetical protein
MTDKIYVGIDDKRVLATGQVLETILADMENDAATRAAQQAEAEAKATAKAALLARLGITAEEAVLLLS